MRAMLRDPEQYADSIASPSTAAALLPTEIHSAHTKIMPGSTIQEAGRQTDIKTEVMPAYLSQVTDIKGGAKPIPEVRSRRFGLVAGGLAAVLLACTAVGGAYLYNPALFDRHSEQAPAADVPVVEDVPAPIVESNVNDASANAMATAVNNSAVVTPSSPEKPRESAKTSRPQTTSKPEARSFIIDGDTIYMGNTRISNGKIDNPNSSLDPNGVPPRPGVNAPTIPPPDLRHLTPEQRRKVLRALRRNGVIIARPSPQ
jgi:hypothetical protein